jgi:hypothetical protein
MQTQSDLNWKFVGVVVLIALVTVVAYDHVLKTYIGKKES